ncbi:hypothetical protein ACT7C8_17570 [Bacillus cereus]|uniref:Uncharacterized protein n=1 Tax=Bacillus cereus TaxID=1396 RepID=A0A9X7M129_BACCE|nr:hypothetical protein [Bacillus cereus]QDZ76844.1 hypothetical protein D0437_28940 [Bacillus cereus]
MRKESIVQIGYGTFILVKGDEFYAYRIVCRYYVACSYRTQCDHTIYRKNNQGMEQENRMSMKETEKELGHS